jgi:hypothetical protein
MAFLRAPATLLLALAAAACDAGAAAQAEGDVPVRPQHLHDAKVATGDAAPDFVLPSVDGGPIRLSSLRGRPTVLVFGSHTCDVFGAQTRALREVFEWASPRVNFLFVYVREAHAADEWPVETNEARGLRVPQPRTREQRLAQARLCVRDFPLETMPTVVDDVDDPVSRVYGGFPARIYVLDEEGVIRYQSAAGPFGVRPNEVRTFLQRRWRN